jgi:hypothetical protein
MTVIGQGPQAVDIAAGAQHISKAHQGTLTAPVGQVPQHCDGFIRAAQPGKKGGQPDHVGQNDLGR